MEHNHLVAAVLLVLFLLVGTLHVTALYQDDAGKLDWQQQHIGQVTHAVFATHGSGDQHRHRHVYVATKENVIAALSLKNGDIAWRRVLAEGESVLSLAVDSTKKVLISRSSPASVFVAINSTAAEKSASQAIQLVRTWSLSEGHLLHETIEQVAQEVAPSNGDKSVSKSGSTAVMADPWVDPLSGQVFTMKASVSLDNTHIYIQHMAAGGTEVRKVHEFHCTHINQSKRGYNIRAMWIAPVYDQKKTDQTVVAVVVVGFHLLLVMDDTSLTYIQSVEGTRKAHFNSDTHNLNEVKQVWTREEALSNVVEALIVDVPPSSSRALIPDSSLTNPLTAFIARVSRQISWVVSLVRPIESSPANETTTSSSPSSIKKPAIEEAKNLTQDHFGFRKVIVAATRSGSVFGLDSAVPGQVLWSFPWNAYVRAPDVKDPENTISIRLLEPQNHMQHSRAFNTSEIIVIVDVKDDRSHILRLNAITGDLLLNTYYRPSILHAALLYGSAFTNHPLVIVDTERKAHLYDTTADAQSVSNNDVRRFVVDNAHRIHWHEVQHHTDGATVLMGFGLKQDASGWLQPVELWNMRFVDKVVSVVHSSLDPVLQHVYSTIQPAPQPSDRSKVTVLLRKYLNPNLFAVATTHRTSGSGGDAMDVLFLDGVSGRVVHTIRHAGVLEAPRQILLNDNTASYTFKTARKDRRQELAVFEFYYDPDSPVQHSSEFSSLDEYKLMVFERAYIFPYKVQALGGTQTAHGITNKHLLVATHADQLIALDWRLISARRPMDKPSAIEAEEGLLPYSPMLPIAHTSVISYSRVLPRLQGIQSAPSHMESTCHVFAWGLDLFYTRITPAKSFDILHDDFSRLLLVVTCLAVLIVTIAMRKIASIRTLRAAWR